MSTDVRMDLNRLERCGHVEAIYGPGKRSPELIEAVRQAQHGPVLITRIPTEHVDTVLSEGAAQLTYDNRSGCMHTVLPSPSWGDVAIITAGSSDLRVAEEAALTCAIHGIRVKRFYDVGVAGIHRTFAHIDAIREARLIIVVAGMDGALPSVIGGLVSAPVIAVPTSIGYGSAFEGLSALLAMLNSCAAGITVVNIDNGFGAGIAATRMIQILTPISSEA